MSVVDGLLFGNYRAKVVDNNDPQLFGRVRVWIPDVMPDIEESPEECLWAYPANNPIGGRNDIEASDTQYYQGSCFIPTVGSYVWVFFENGNLSKPYYFASLDIKCAPVLAENQSGSQPWNKWTIFKSPEGRCVVISDDPADCRIEITGKKRLLTDYPSGDLDSVFEIEGNQTTILLEETRGNEKILIKTHKGDFINIDVSKQELHTEFKNSIHIQSIEGDINLTAGKSINILAQKQLYLTGDATTHVKSNGIVAIDGSQTRIQQGMARRASAADPVGLRSTNASGNPADYSSSAQDGGIGFDIAQVNSLTWTDEQSDEGQFGDISGETGTGPSDPDFTPNQNDKTNLGKSFATWLANIEPNVWQTFKDGNGVAGMEVMKRGTSTLDFRIPGSEDILRSFTIPDNISKLGLNFDVTKLPSSLFESFGNQLWDELKDLLGFHFEGFMKDFGGVVKVAHPPKNFDITNWTTTHGLGDIKSNSWKSFKPKDEDYYNLANSFLTWSNDSKRGKLNPFYDQRGQLLGYIKVDWLQKTRELVYTFYNKEKKANSKVVKIKDSGVSNKNILQEFGKSIWVNSKSIFGPFFTYFIKQQNGDIADKEPDYGETQPPKWDPAVPPAPPTPSDPTYSPAPTWMDGAVVGVKNWVSGSQDNIYQPWPGQEDINSPLHGYKIKFESVQPDVYDLTYQTASGSTTTVRIDFSNSPDYIAAALWDWADSNVRGVWSDIYNTPEPEPEPVEPPDPDTTTPSGQWDYSDSDAPNWMLWAVNWLDDFVTDSSSFNIYQIFPGFSGKGNYLIKKEHMCGGKYKITWTSAGENYHDHTFVFRPNDDPQNISQQMWQWADRTIKEIWARSYA